MLDTLRAAIHYAPLHIPPALALIDTASKLYPQAPAFACFDTAFHTTMPPEAYTYAIPARFREQGVQRYGFHGLSYESIVAALSPAVPARLVVAHLGNGASLCAIANGRSVDTSMGLTPTGGIPMGTRSGDLDPGVVLFLARSGLSNSASGELSNIDALESVLNHESGLAGLSSGAQSGGTNVPGMSDMRELTAAAGRSSDRAPQQQRRPSPSSAAPSPKPSPATPPFSAASMCSSSPAASASTPPWSASRSAASSPSSASTLDAEANQRHAATISQQTSPIPTQITVQIIPADEDGRIAHHVSNLLAQ